MAEAFSFRLAEKVRRTFLKFKVQYLFIGKGGAILLGYSDTTQDADVFVQKTVENTARLVKALKSLKFKLTHEMVAEILRGKDFIQLRNGPFDMDLIFAPDGIESFDSAWKRHVTIKGYPVCHIDDIVRSKEKANRIKDRETLPRLRAFREYLKSR